jgi:diguanylate cyclase (GGDEF)-like protein
MPENTRATTCVLFDVSAMQAFNDDNGRDAGDKLLAEIMSVLVKCFPAASEVTRFSGDEFLVVAANGNAEFSAKLARDASNEILDRFGVTITFGIGSGVSAGDAKRSATLALFEHRARQ